MGKTTTEDYDPSQRLSQKGCHKTVTELKRALVPKREAESTALSFPLPPPQKSWTTHPSPLLSLHSCSAVLGYSHSPANISSAAGMPPQDKPLNFPFTCLWNLAFLDTAPAPTPLERKLLQAHFLVWRLVSPPRPRTCSPFLPGMLPLPYTDPWQAHSLMNHYWSSLSPCTAALVNAQLCSQPPWDSAVSLSKESCPKGPLEPLVTDLKDSQSVNVPKIKK